MKGRATLIILLLCAGGGLLFGAPAGKPYTLSSSVTLPPDFYVGDHVELRVHLAVPTGSKREAPVKMPQTQWVRVDSIRLLRNPGSVELRIQLVSYAPGIVDVPPIDLGAFTVTGLTVRTASLLTEGGTTRLSDPKPQLLLPGTTFFLALLIAVLIAVPLFFLLVVGRLAPRLAAMLEEHRARRPWNRLSQALTRLESAIGAVDAREFYIRLCEEIRRYLTSSLGRDFSSVTAREFARTAAGREIDAESSSSLAAILSFGDLVKFAGQPALLDERARDLGEARRCAQRLELQGRQVRAERQGSVKGGAAAGGARR